MVSAVEVRCDGAVDAGVRGAKSAASQSVSARGAARQDAIALEIHDALAPVADRWRAFEQTADATVFQAYEWLAAWQRHIGEREGARPVVVVGTVARGATLFLMPLAVVSRG
jgi:CelD/BcsL family acetyltransferase involved in cellulose biosynthesis